MNVLLGICGPIKQMTRFAKHRPSDSFVAIRPRPRSHSLHVPFTVGLEHQTMLFRSDFVPLWEMIHRGDMRPLYLVHLALCTWFDPDGEYDADQDPPIRTM
ncbi:hypothetical protein [Novipirellula maiorica]|uniref:hypothetical protein n=1 Tax=Novipirellula maiorica TaxID=1265734 RepID=UPI001181ACF5|nr:hypothetical protein [Rhodopirellula maiorica]